MTALQNPSNDELERIRDEVRSTYTEVAVAPNGTFHFHRGAAYAAERLGYDADELDALPAAATARFAGVGNPHLIGPVRPGETVVDLGCGAGMDLMLAARRVGSSGRAIGIDMTAAMRAQARIAVYEAGLRAVAEVREGHLEALPIEDASVDVVMSNGVVNLVADKEAVFAEIVRILRPGGRLHLADVVVRRSIKEEARSNAELWAACIAGAMSIDELQTLSAASGLRDGTFTHWFDAYAGTSAEHKVSKDLHVRGANFFARK
jgi:arsenite methyltransferase